MSFLLLKALCKDLLITADVLFEADASTDVGHKIRNPTLNRVAAEGRLRT